MASGALKYVDKDTFTRGMNVESTDENARIDWKFGCSRSVSGTPTAFVNRVLLTQDVTSMSLKDWNDLIQQILDNQ